MAICPTGAIQIFGRTLSPDGLFDLPLQERAANYGQLLTLYQRRSVSEFLDKPVESDIIEKILVAARTSPMGLPPSDVNVLISAENLLKQRFRKQLPPGILLSL